MIREGSPVLINTLSTNYLTIALEEIAAGKVNYIDAPEIPDDEVPHNAAHEATLAAGARHSAAMQMLDESLSAAHEDDAEDDGESISDELAETEDAETEDADTAAESDSVQDAENE
jgi:hypothetical protein